MSVAQEQEHSPQSRSRTRLTPGLNTTTSATSSRPRAAATILLPSVALMFALSCLLSPVLVQANTSAGDPVSVVVDAAASLAFLSSACGNPLHEKRITTAIVHGLDSTPHADFLASLLESETTTVALDQDGKTRSVLRVSRMSTFVVDKTDVAHHDSKGSRTGGGEGGNDRLQRSIVTENGGASTATLIQQSDNNDTDQLQQQRHQRAIGVFEDQRMDEFEDLIGGTPSRSRTSFAGEEEVTPKVEASSPLFSLPPLDWIRAHLGTKSPYPHESRPVGPLEDTPEGYELVQLQLICRHGTRYPSASKSIGFKTLADRLKGVELPGFEWIKDWPSDALYPPARGNLLSVQGDADLYQIGRRFAIRYKTLLDKYPYDANSYVFASSAKSRSLQSAYGFSVGFFEGRLAADSGSEVEKGVIGQRPPVQPVDISMLPIGLDKELAMKYACPRWLDNVKDQPGIVHENTQFQSKFVPVLAERLTAVLSAGAKTPADRFNITVKDIGVLENLCGFEVAMHNTEKTWCRFLGLGLSSSSSEGVDDGHEEERESRGVETLAAAKDIFRKFEIAGDLDDFYTHGPGVPFNRHLGCKLGTSLVDSIEMALTEDKTGGASEPQKYPSALGDDDEEVPGVSRAVLKFGHSETILFFSSFLGLYSQKGVLLTGDMTPKQYAEREFRTSKISQFAANMAFEVYRPIAETSPSSSRKSRRRLDTEAAAIDARLDGDNTNSAPRGLIRLLVNEVPMVLPGCGSDYFCEWSTFKTVLQRAGTGCDFDSCCSTLTKPSPPSVLEKEAQASVTSRGFRAVQAAFKKPQLPVCLSVDPIVK